MNRIVHFEIHADDPERAGAFYRNIFGWNIKKWNSPEMEYWIVMTGPKEEPGINGGLLRRKGGTPAADQCVNAFVCTVEVSNIDDTIKKIEQADGTLALPKFALPKMAWQAYYKDTEGNIFGIHQLDTNAG